ncbi:uncharacterized mitochondrial protein AtMg00810-like [Cryptomeria japonica]|uniref:uncharacterized mitochondrial protein AtMg00810-like n=1 Tax=Cryptomeria japonica TaxID=3369 RepID=UPI0027DA069B|nr:uncharacterized mitochondrial protein AtMg00810-like [Cryptomeria japonica]
MTSEFEMSMLGELSFFLGLQVSQLENGIFISQTKYAKDMLKRFQMAECNAVSTPMATGCKLSKVDDTPTIDQTMYRSMIGSFLYLTATRPDFMQAVCMVSRFQSAPERFHFITIQRILKYIKGTLDFGLWYPRNDNFTLLAYIDVDWAGCVDDRKSTNGATFFLGDSLVAWHNKKQDCISLSTAKE